jgi:hypothetical protein
MEPDWEHRKDAWGRDIDDPAPKLNLLETGTRWAHYAELRDLFTTGIEIINNMTTKSSGDQLKRVKLEGAVEMLDARINLLSDFLYNTTYGSKLRGIIDCDVTNLYRTMTLEKAIKDEKEKDSKDSREKK